MKLGLVNMDFDYGTYFGLEHSTGYERLLRDCMAGDATLFQRSDMSKRLVNVIQPILDVWHACPPAVFPNYAAGSWVLSRRTICWNATAARGGGSAKRKSTTAAGLAAPDKTGIIT